MCVFGSDFLSPRNCLLQGLGMNFNLYAFFCERGNNRFSGNVSHQIVTGEWTAAEARQCAIETPAPCVIRGQNFCGSVLGTAVKMNAQLDTPDTILNRMVKRADVGSWPGADRVGKR